MRKYLIGLPSGLLSLVLAFDCYVDWDRRMPAEKANSLFALILVLAITVGLIRRKPFAPILIVAYGCYGVFNGLLQPWNVAAKIGNTVGAMIPIAIGLAVLRAFVRQKKEKFNADSSGASYVR